MVSASQYLRALERDINGQNNWPFQSKSDWRKLYRTSCDAESGIFQLPVEVYKTSDLRMQTLVNGLRSAIKPVQNWVFGCWLHGSLGSADYKMYSDVDALLLIREEGVTNPIFFKQIKLAVRRALYHVLMFDPLQHHGFFVGTEKIFGTWPADYLPTAALVHARPIWEPGQIINLHEYHDAEQEKQLFLNLVSYIKQFSVPKTLYQAKAMLSQFMLLPAAYCQAIGNPIYKRESFAIVQNEFQSWWKPMEEATRMRENWLLISRPFWQFSLSIMNPWLASKVYRKFENQIPSTTDYQNWENFIQDIQKLAHQMLLNLP